MNAPLMLTTAAIVIAAIEPILKFTLCVLRTQMGKTFTTISRINDEINRDGEVGRSLHIVFTMNTLLNNAQFAKRLETLERTFGKGTICVCSSTYNGPYEHVKNRKELQGICSDKITCPRVVVMCSNTIRYDDGVEFMKVIESNNWGHLFRAFVYYDELHKYITDTLRSQIEQIHDLKITHGIMALSASPDKIWQETGFWSKLKLIDLDNFAESDYVGYSDMVFNCVDDFFENPYIRPSPFDFDELDRQTIDFIDWVLKKYPEILGENTISFIPAHVRRIGHNAVRDLVFSINPNAVVCLINGQDKNIQYKDVSGNTKTLPLLSTDEEVCETISRLVLQHKLQNRAIVITGYLCVGMGQTLTHKMLGSFTSAIFGHMDLTNDDIYQLFGRITGRMKNWGDKYVQTQVYCPTIIMNRCHVMEECARNIARDYNGKPVTRDDYIKPMFEMGDIGASAVDNIRAPTKKKQKKNNGKNVNSINREAFRVYNSNFVLDSVIEKLKTPEMCLKYDIKPPGVDGFIKTSLNKKSDVVSLESVTKKIHNSYGGGKGSKIPLRTVYPCYVDVTDKSTLRFVLIIRPGTDPDKLAQVDEQYPRCA
jgi:hypothetical protein